MSTCNQCIHFREAKPISGLLRLDTAVDIYPAAMEELIKIKEQEQKLRDTEAQTKNHQESRGREDWPGCPRMSAFCGLQESQRVYLISEIKNRGGRCTDFAPGPPPKRSCRDCEYHINPQGDYNDAVQLKSIADLITMGAITGTKDSIAGGLLTQFNQSIGPKKAGEMQSAHSSGYLVNEPPYYLHYCQKFSTNDKFVICVLQNPHETCSAWKKGSNPPPSSQSPGSSQGRNATAPTTGSKIVAGLLGVAGRTLVNYMQQKGSTQTAKPQSNITNAAQNTTPSTARNKPWKFEALQQTFYENPNGGYKILLDQATLWVYGPAQLRLAYPFSNFPKDRWTVLRNGNNALPLQVRRDGQGRLFIEWQ